MGGGGGRRPGSTLCAGDLFEGWICVGSLGTAEGGGIAGTGGVEHLSIQHLSTCKSQRMQSMPQQQSGWAGQWAKAKGTLGLAVNLRPKHPGPCQEYPGRPLAPDAICAVGPRLELGPGEYSQSPTAKPCGGVS